MADPMLAIPNYEAIRDSKEISDAREALAATIRTSPPKIFDRTDELLFQHTTGENLFPKLGRTKKDIQNAVLDCEVKAPIPEDKSRIISWDEYRKDRSIADIAATSLDYSETEKWVKQLSVTQRIAIVRVVFARRHAGLTKNYEKIASDPKANGKILDIQQRIEFLENNFENALLRWASVKP